ncbi:hypothetical protein VM98_03080 [Streptomyces rubellomurinus subsp. indigoferus]|nr:hypothetical protein VM98_03080 [Streptomyces rubellomurinus subsp. indigoferus]
MRLVHASASAPEVPGDPGPYTLCGLDTSAMLVEHWVRDRPGLRWYPPRWTGQICPTCEAAVRAG